ncbi:hypothetical protein LZ906_007880 [Paraclostridium ghonii]|uniref:hypothetical protein n=1 Tax=Paraclostridium ghonii TaxID=29358 RepID=UPI0035254728
MFAIDFTKPWLYKDIVYFNQGDLSTNNTFRCKVITGGLDDLTDCDVVCTFKTNNSKEISQAGRVVDGKGLIIDIVFPSNALALGVNELEILINSTEDGVAQSPAIKYEIWKGITTGNGIQGESNYPILIQLINTTNEALNNANNALNNANTVINKLPYINASIEESIKATANANIATENSKITVENLKKDFNALEASKQQDAEVIKARDGEVSLQDRLERDLAKGKLVEETKEGTYLSFNDTVGGIVSYLEVQGNTVQDVSRLQDIKSVGIPSGDGTYKISILSCGKNLIDIGKVQRNSTINSDGQIQAEDGGFVTDFIKIDSSKKYVRNFATSNYNTNSYYDSNKRFISREFTSILNTPSNAKYVRCKFKEYEGIQLEEGTVSTPYTPYEGTRCDIKLPCQLAKWDRLYFDKEEKTWCINKGTVTGLIDGSTLPIEIYQQGSNTVRLKWDRLTVLPNSNTFSSNADIVQMYCNKLKFNLMWSKDEEGIYADSFLVIKLNKAKIGEVISQQTITNYLKNNNMEIKCRALVPQKIVLPKDIQIKLNSFANKTHIYTIAGDVDATIKAAVSKSLASTVQANSNEINNLSNRVADIEGLRESQDFEYETNKGYLVCKDTKNGVVKDMKIYGKSLVNISSGVLTKQGSAQISSLVSTTNNLEYKITNPGSYVILKKGTFKKDTDYTIIANVKHISSINDLSFSFYSYVTGKYTISQTDIKKLNNTDYAGYAIKLNTRDVDVHAVVIGCHRSDTPIDSILGVKDVLVLEGDHTQNPPSYFEGIASVGNGIEVSSRKEYGNLFDETQGVSIFKGDWNYDGEKFVIDSKQNYLSNWYHIRVEPNTQYYVSAELDAWVRFYKGRVDSHGDGTTHLGSIEANRKSNIITTDVSGWLTVRLTCETKQGISFIKNIMISKQNKPYEEYKTDKKTILFKDIDNTWNPITELRGIDLNNCDTIEKHSDGKFFYSKRIKSKKFLGTEKFEVSSDSTSTMLRVLYNATSDGMKGNRSPLLSDKFSLKTDYSTNVEGIFTSVSGSTIFFDILKSKVSDLDAFKNIIKDTTVLFPSISEEIYEVNPLDLESFEHETMISIDAGVIVPYTSWKISSYLLNFVRNLSSQVRQLQDQVYKTNVANFTVALNTLDTKLRLNKLESSNN